MPFALAVLLFAFQPAAPAPSIAVPAGQHMVLTARGRGFQVYRCEQPAGSPTAEWKFFFPRAELFSKEQKVGTHGAGPSWQYKDGSRVEGTVLASAPSENLGAIPQLLLRATHPTGTGLFSRVTYIQRTATQQGVAPQTGCDAAHLGQVAEVLYQATYTFYAAER